MHAELREKVAREISGAPFPSKRSLAKADAIIATLRDALLSDDVVEQFHRTYETFGQSGHLKSFRLSDDHVRACLAAALEKIGAQNVAR